MNGTCFDRYGKIVGIGDDTGLVTVLHLRGGISRLNNGWLGIFFCYRNICFGFGVGLNNTGCGVWLFFYRGNVLHSTCECGLGLLANCCRLNVTLGRGT